LPAGAPAAETNTATPTAEAAPGVVVAAPISAATPAATSDAANADGAQSGDFFFIFNNGSGGDGDVTMSFGGSHNDDYSEATHGATTYVIGKFKAKKVPADLDSIFVATIDGAVLIACPADAESNNPWVRHSSVDWEGSEQQELAQAMEAPEDGAPYIE